MINTTSFPAVAVTLWILGGFSFATWALILIKAVQHLRLAAGDKRYAKRFWGAVNLQAVADIEHIDSPLQRLATAGLNVLRNLIQSNGHDLEHSWDQHELLERNLRQQVQREKRGLESGLALLATVGSTAPFVGLFGTVWGIMSAMRNISRIGNASIDVVAGPIGEALIATGIGIAVAVPAVLGYNYFLRRQKIVLADLDDFGHDFLNLAQRATYRIERGVRPSDVRHDIRSKRRSRDFVQAALPAAVGEESIQ